MAAPAPLKLLEPLDLCEAVDGDGEVLLRDANYVHAAVRRVGLGRVVFTSFPIDALDHADPRTAALWIKLLDLEAPAHDWTSSALGQERDSILEAMIGAPAAPWSLAAAVAGGYVLLILLVQFAVGGARRPAAFAIGAAVAIVACGTLVGLTRVRGGGQSISAARLSTIELGPLGGGVRHEALAFLGRDESAFGLSTDLPATLRPAVASANDPPAIDQLPFAAPGAGVHSGRVDRVWQASDTIAADKALLATAQFTPEGVKIEIDNRTGQEVLAPLLLWNRHCYRLPGLPPGRSGSLLGPRNAPGDYTNVSVFTGEEADLRGRIAQLALAPRSDAPVGFFTEQPPILLGWLAPAASDSPAAPIVHYSIEPRPMLAQIMLRAPLQIRPSPAGASVRVPSDFVVTSTGATAGGIPYDPTHHEWLPSIRTGNWIVGFQLPPQIGKFKPLSASISADMSVPGHTIVLRRGQCSNGVVGDNPQGPIVAQWNQAIGSRTASIDLDANDVDSRGFLWLRLSVEDTESGASASGVLPQWKINDLAVSYEVQAQDRSAD